MNQLIIKVFVAQPLASPGSAKYTESAHSSSVLVGGGFKHFLYFWAEHTIQGALVY